MRSRTLGGSEGEKKESHFRFISLPLFARRGESRTPECDLLVGLKDLEQFAH